MFFTSHSPFERPYSRQYQTVAFYKTEQELEILKNLRKTYEDRADKENKLVHTRLQNETTFYTAENHHQKYYLQKHPDYTQHLMAHFGSFDAFVDSLSAAKLSAYLVGLGDWSTFERDLPLLNLSPLLEDRLRRIFSRYVLRG